MSLSTITIYDNTRWDRYISNAYTFDFNHTWYYHSTSRGEAVLLIYKEDDDYIALPLIKNISGNGSRTLTGFAGPVASSNFALIDNGLQERFEIAFLQYLNDHGITSSSIRLHPLIHASFQPLLSGSLQQHGDSLLIDLSRPPEVQPSHFGDHFSNNVALLRRKGHTVRQAVSIHDVDTFAEIYQQNSLHLHANATHYDKAWFRQILRPSGFKSTLLLSFLDGRITAGILLTFCNDVMQLHLAATHDHYLSHTPLQLLLAEADSLGRSLGMQYAYLGGMAGRTDALFTCKAMTTDTYPGFRSWQVVTHTAVLMEEISMAV